MLYGTEWTGVTDGDFPPGTPSGWVALSRLGFALYLGNSAWFSETTLTNECSYSVFYVNKWESWYRLRASLESEVRDARITSGKSKGSRDRVQFNDGGKRYSSVRMEWREKINPQNQMPSLFRMIGGSQGVAPG